MAGVGGAEVGEESQHLVPHLPQIPVVQVTMGGTVERVCNLATGGPCYPSQLKAV